MRFLRTEVCDGIVLGCGLSGQDPFTLPCGCYFFAQQLVSGRCEKDSFFLQYNRNFLFELNVKVNE